LKHEGKSRMPAQRQTHRPATHERVSHHADASAKPDTPTGAASTQKARGRCPRSKAQTPNSPRREVATQMPAKAKNENQTTPRSNRHKV
ncbi:hypothetical protein, partial [Paraburkholderia hospita]